MKIVVGVVGPHSIVDHVATMCEAHAGVQVERFSYEREYDIVRIVDTHKAAVDAWLFTGIASYAVANEADLLDRPAVFVDYTGATLLGALIRLMGRGDDISKVSIDTMPVSKVQETFMVAGVPIDDIRVLPHKPGLTSEEIVTFHRRHRRAVGESAVAITCDETAVDVLSAEMSTLQLVPSSPSVRVALHQLILSADSQLHEDSQIALGLVELPGPDTQLRVEAAALAGSVARLNNGLYVLMTTKGPLSEATSGLKYFPMLRRLADRHSKVRVGFGLGRSAAEAESLARRALARAQRIGDVAAVLSLRGDRDITLAGEDSAPDAGVITQSRLAQRVGLAPATIARLRQVHAATGSSTVTTRDIAEHLGVQLRTARRVLHRLETAGFAERAGTRPAPAGRPLTLYRLTLGMPDDHGMAVRR